MNNKCEIKLSEYSCTSTSTETEPLNLERLTRAMDLMREEQLKLYKEELWGEKSRINIKQSMRDL